MNLLRLLLPAPSEFKLGGGRKPLTAVLQLEDVNQADDRVEFIDDSVRGAHNQLPAVSELRIAAVKRNANLRKGSQNVYAANYFESHR